MPDCQRGGYISERNRNKRTAKKAKKSTLTRNEILEAMDKRGLNPSCSRVSTGPAVFYDREGRY